MLVVHYKKKKKNNWIEGSLIKHNQYPFFPREELFHYNRAAAGPWLVQLLLALSAAVFTPFE